MLKIAIEGYPFKKVSYFGPEIFMHRLSDSIVNQKLAIVRRTILPFYDIALFKITSKSKYKKPFVLRVDGIYFDNKNTIGDSDKMNSDIFSSIKMSNGVIFISDFCRKLVETFNGKVSKSFVIIHNSVDIKLFSPIGNNFRSRCDFSNNDRVIVVSASWRRHKRLKETILLFRRLREYVSDRQSYKLLVLGGEPDYVEKDKDIIYVGKVDPRQLPAWYRTGDIFIHLSWIEPCGNTQIEAMACGLPVVCTNNGGVGETIMRANGGIVSQADDEYGFNKIDYYNPPEPNYDVLISDIERIFNNYEQYVKNIDYGALNINNGAKKYVGFIKEIWEKTTCL
jgi:glycosyltransferase involved in cell wall biosynthesis